MDRIIEKIEFGNLTISVIQPEDILIFKSVADGVEDRKNVIMIIKESNVEWELILKESQWQTEHEEKAFSVFLFDFLEDLKEMGADVPKDVLRKVRKISQDEMLKVLKSKRGNVREK
jgi:hypothetical protein